MKIDWGVVLIIAILVYWGYKRWLTHREIMAGKRTDHDD